jgi:HTH-type transcriptional regulator/antitoxin HigA
METTAIHGIHPGKILKEELESRNLSADAFALELRVPPRRVQEIVAGTRAISPETADDLHQAELRHGDQIAREVDAA